MAFVDLSKGANCKDQESIQSSFEKNISIESVQMTFKLAIWNIC